MSSIFGTTTNPTPSNPTVGSGQQQSFFNDLYNLGTQVVPGTEGQTQNGQPITQFAGMAPYTGQLTPNLSNMMSNNVWNSWNQQPQGMSAMQNASQGLQNFNQGIQNQIGQQSPWLSQFMNPQVSYPLPKAPVPSTGNQAPVRTSSGGR